LSVGESKASWTEGESEWQAAPRVPVGYSDTRSSRHVEDKIPKSEARTSTPVDDGWLVAKKRGKAAKAEPQGSPSQVQQKNGLDRAPKSSNVNAWAPNNSNVNAWAPNNSNVNAWTTNRLQASFNQSGKQNPSQSLVQESTASQEGRSTVSSQEGESTVSSQEGEESTVSSQDGESTVSSQEGDWFLAMKGIAPTTIDERKIIEELKQKLHDITELEYLEAKGDILNDNQQALLASKNDIAQQLQLYQ